MGIMAERLARIEVRVSAPDGQLVGVYGGAGEVTVEFSKGSYRHCTERSLERALSYIINGLWAGRQRAREAVIAEVSGIPARRHKEIVDPGDRRYEAEVAKTHFEGMSESEYVYMQNTGFRDWRVVIRDGTLSNLDENAFRDEFRHAFLALIRDSASKTSRMRREHRRTARGNHKKTSSTP